MVRPLRRLLTRARPLSTASVSTERCVGERAKAVLHLLTNKGTLPLTLKEAEYCNEACITRLLKAKGNQVKKAAKQLRATLAWRANRDVDYMTADEFSAELAMGNAYVAGHDEHGRPVLIVRLKPESLSTQSQKQFLRYMVFCMEVAIGCMPSEVEQCVLIVDAGCLKKGSPGISAILQLLKMIGEHYPERVARTFVVDAPAIFYLLWKGMGKFLDLKMREKMRFVYSRDYNALALTNTVNMSSLAVVANNPMRAMRTYSNRSLCWADDQQSDVEDHRREDRGNADANSVPTCTFAPSDTLNLQTMQTPTSSARPTVTSLASLLSSASFSLATSSSVSPSSSTASGPLVSSSSSASSSVMTSSSSSSSLLSLLHRPPTSSGPALLSDKNQARSLSFASALSFRKENTPEFCSFRADARLRRVRREEGSSRRWADLAFGFKQKDDLSSNHIETPLKDGNYALFMPYYTTFVSKPYNEAAYRAYMKPPLAGLISILGPDIKHRQPSFSIHTTAMEAMLHHLQLD